MLTQQRAEGEGAARRTGRAGDGRVEGLAPQAAPREGGVSVRGEAGKAGCSTGAEARDGVRLGANGRVWTSLPVESGRSGVKLGPAVAVHSTNCMAAVTRDRLCPKGWAWPGGDILSLSEYGINSRCAWPAVESDLVKWVPGDSLDLRP